jgi:hypothetical protein
MQEKEMKITVFVQSELLPEVQAVEVDHDTTAHALRAALLSLLPQQPEIQTLALYVEDSDDELALEKLTEIPDGLRVQLHRLKGIDVTVRYAGRDVRRTFRPSATLMRVKRWATREFGITPSDAAELMLQVSGTDQRPDPDTHIGSLVKSPQKSLCLDLVPSTRVNG